MIYAIVAVIILILDQAMKYWTTANILVDTGTVPLIPGVIHLANVHNLGAAFSFLSGARWFFVVLCIIFVAVVVWVLAKDIIRTPVARWMAVFVLAGAIGNCIDRILCGFVVDMFEFEFFTFPVFNVADIFITCGAIAFCVCVLVEKEPTKAGAPAQSKDAAAAAAEAPAADEPTRVLRRSKTPKAPKAPRKKKTEIPSFPKREHTPLPAVDPNDPFAEWEKRAKESARKADAPSAHASYTQPAQSAPAAPAAPAAPTQPAELAQPVQPAPAESAAKPAAEDYDLDSILAEFHDL